VPRGGLLVLALLVAGAVPLRAQLGAGEITGTVTDQAGAALAGATVTVTHVATNRSRSVVTSRQGVYTAASLLPGEYRIDVSRAGFKQIQRTHVRLSTGELARLDFSLPIGEIREQVTVTADAAIARQETASLGLVIEQEQLVQLPLNGRSFITLASLAPGVALPPTSPLPRINGGRPRTNSICSTVSRCCSRSPARSRSSRSWTQSRNSGSRATARRRSSAA